MLIINYIYDEMQKRFGRWAIRKPFW